ncbi:hypothetical protein FSS13T_12610 [Flavobacterium saliperosum S13]|uniref:Uncharacterized protein n=1 Tax=Flavobacterium saliperosum S13 TaxID=1341155 RepID=A0ABN0QHF4_9FLAO|nr:hypothetical protein FSS13T_12610 [Flavobacterium saliperosum S13]
MLTKTTAGLGDENVPDREPVAITATGLALLPLQYVPGT